MLDKVKIDYVLYHLNLSLNLNDYEHNLIFIPISQIKDQTFKNKIIFPLSENNFNENDIKIIKDIPVLFPMSRENKFYYLDEWNNLIFNHDFITSSFYLLSGQQEYKSNSKDHFGRFRYKDSIQEKINIIHKPVVNYYFEIISQGFKEWGKRNNLKIELKKLFKSFGVLLTHDIDRVDTFNYHEVGFRLKVLLGLSPSNENLSKKIKSFIYYFLNWINLFKKNNHHWDFEKIRDFEKKYNYKSVFFFLQKDQLHKDSYYLFNDKRIQCLIDFLNKDSCEIGLHGTVRSAFSFDAMHKINTNLRSVSPQQVLGIRQHRLIYQNSVTGNIQEKNGLKYDSTLGFAEHEGFRNSFCLPFKTFDHENNKMLNVWEFPLIAMDTTLFIYRQLNVDESLNTVNKLIQETIKFNGLFTFLWHNGFQVDCKYPKIEQFYEILLMNLNNYKGENILGKELYEKLINN